MSMTCLEKMTCPESLPGSCGVTTGLHDGGATLEVEVAGEGIFVEARTVDQIGVVDVVGLDLDVCGDGPLPLGQPFPPGFQAVDDEVAGLVLKIKGQAIPQVQAIQAASVAEPVAQTPVDTEQNVA